MKYLDKVIKVDKDGKNYTQGVRIEISYSELETLYEALEMASDLEGNPTYKMQEELMEKIINVKDYASRNMVSMEA
ncbi:hypothetical protein J2Q04_13285, partial [Tenacibaculum finnmarkense genomovar finnmarkense]|uniref:hypothetical protein n=1 Tax=Tenacibaculum finnmarkense TaxID=2781243 RepID=UPI001E342C1E|nr:hypothetical protein [Tenacibaculum finnmarkense]MCD8450429.1 hypothetical protein [Tenacibaculum dicentrarchi]MCG8203587.1 hypothetical protein [Tenacibaculum finnmarkense genomovar finnmarkense]MCG8245113.1 hypothetical protein [Tenacibaculum finnmarkense genomovar finnmarkense]MCG8740059.1 hypothetical protein [Tenacibaculum finnmarkense]MCG8781677.1 hypothetical protein [Tenacibaculum finnmarkense]